MHQKANNKYMKDYDKNKESSYFRYWDANNSRGCEISLKLSENGLKENLFLIKIS